MAEHILFLTGKLAEKSLHRVLESMQPTEFTYEVRQLGVSVAALMTTQLIEKRLTDTGLAQKVILPGRCRGDIEALSNSLKLPVERGPDELKDLPAYFGQVDRKADLSQYDVQIFAEIVDAPMMTVADIVKRAQTYKEDGANVIDLGCLPSTPFPHLAESVQALKAEGFKVSVDSLTPEDLVTGGKAGADFLLSLSEKTLWILDEVNSTPILIGNTPSDARSLYRAIEQLIKQGREFIADSILDPIHFGFTESIIRYRNLRKRYPDIEIIMGIGNLTELTHADSAGTNAILLGIISELEIRHVLATEVSEHCRYAVREADLARRVMYASRIDSIPPKGYDNGLMALHERKPFPYTIEEVKEFAAEIKDPNFRIQVSEEGVHTYNRDGMHTATDPYEIYPKLNVDDDGGHAFYLGIEHARAQIAWQLGKRYEQDEELDWGVSTKSAADDLSQFKEAGTTMHTRKTRKDKRLNTKKKK
ncbi:MAG: dihydropteroate synthase [Gammaproteobacteria bacterium]|nr:MAG: dihydropteroate synthase [Gammaproteobacteria bacterium]